MSLFKHLCSGLVSPMFSSSLQQVGPGNFYKYCFGCGHRGHLWKSQCCPLEKLETFFSAHTMGRKLVRYGCGPRIIRNIQFRSDVMFVFDGFQVAMRDLMDEHKPNRQMRRLGTKLMAKLLARVCNMRPLDFGYFESSMVCFPPSGCEVYVLTHSKATRCYVSCSHYPKDR